MDSMMNSVRLYKLTDVHDQTYGGTQWGEGITHTASGEGDICTAGWIHAYTDPLLAVLLDPIHGNFGPDARLWEAEGIVGKTDHGLKVGCTTLTTLRRIDMPVVTGEQRVIFGILAVMEIYHGLTWTAWANRWLSGEDRTKEAAETAARAVETDAEIVLAMTIALGGAETTQAAVWIEPTVGPPEAVAATAAMWVAQAAVWTAEAALAVTVAVGTAEAAQVAARTTKTLDLAAIARKAISLANQP